MKPKIKILSESERRKMVKTLWEDGKQAAFDFVADQPKPTQQPRPNRNGKRRR